MRFLRFFATLLAALTAALCALPAHAATVSISPATPNPEWSGRPKKDLEDTEIGLADCQKGDSTKVSFDLTLKGFASGNLLQVWAGVTCDQKTSRNESNDCVKLADPTIANTLTITVTARALVQRIPADSAAECTSASAEATTRTLWILAIDQSTNEAIGVAKWQYQFDLTAPSPPTNVTASPGEKALTLEFTPPDDPKLGHYNYFCSEVDGDGTGGTTGSGTTCETSKFAEGDEAPTDATLKCGRESSTFAKSGTTDDKLENGVTYAVAVAAEDAFGNVGKLSNISCASPADVTGFYEAYRAAGGKAGGGFCTFAPAPRPHGPLALALTVAAAALLRRRR